MKGHYLLRLQQSPPFYDCALLLYCKSRISYTREIVTFSYPTLHHLGLVRYQSGYGITSCRVFPQPHDRRTKGAYKRQCQLRYFTSIEISSLLLLLSPLDPQHSHIASLEGEERSHYLSNTNNNNSSNSSRP